MANRFTAGKKAIAECDRCGQRFKLKDLKKEVIKTKQVAIKVCNECWSPDHPQLQLGMYPVADPQAVRDPRPDFAGYAQSRSNIVPVQNFLDSTEFTSASGVVGQVAVVLDQAVQSLILDFSDMDTSYTTDKTLDLIFTTESYQVWQLPAEPQGSYSVWQ